MTVDQAIGSLKLAIQKVPPKYIRLYEPKINVSPDQLERSFAYELYHQWSNILEIYKTVNFKDSNLMINAEISKDYNKIKYPDLILHDGQGNVDNQLLICEIKRDKAKDEHIKNDLEKLNLFLNSNSENFSSFEFKGAAFIMICCKKDFLKNKLKQIFPTKKSLLSSIKAVDKIICISVILNDNVVEVQSFNLKDLYKEDLTHS